MSNIYFYFREKEEIERRERGGRREELGDSRGRVLFSLIGRGFKGVLKNSSVCVGFLTFVVCFVR